ncbi:MULTISPECIES: hypothetical protein [Ralstonia solanacearum species complex]|uniref:DNA replication initiation control protein YabA n=4 Tax=Ralstonia solanacearum species complex TaxID=3116862 RepID=A0A0K1ZIE2_RALSL|nr:MULTISPECIES: hypothetical protein [Ralstonia]AKZ25779.1 hypothetical protein ACH51_05015 [Ralstonia solanacearum]APC69227.1 hypothetical protein RSOE_20120 [Ralstonia solanacearum OE1-1]APF86256.1 hypothetical protein BCR16_05315 [Ralstonia solanacearum FJAT-1458]ARS56831.1 hypothetical protein BC427_12320 [Ralstonia solanacearum FJAT-91]ESS47140.1 hypothetical protein L665_03523 [Ralstonia solanacearum SD54]CBJ37182.1 conserved protein of unknown function [Ralstonia solanacearum CMR15]
MLNELEQLADKIARVLRHADALAAENQRLRAEVERLQAEAEIARTERDAMVADRSVLNAKIEEAQLRIQSILDKLPTGSDARQLDLLGQPAGESAPAPHPETPHEQ